MRIVQMIDSLEWGGAQRMMVSLCLDLKDRGLDVTVISLADGEESPFYDELRQGGIEVAYLPAGGLFDPARFRRLVRVLREGRFDLLQTYLTYANILGGLAGRIAGLPVVGSIRTAARDMRHYHPARFHLESWVLRLFARRVVVNGYAIANVHQDRLGSRPVVVIPNAVAIPAPLQADERAEVRAMLTRRRSGPLVVSVGRLSTPKGYPDLIAAFGQVAAHIPMATLAIIGDGEMMPALSAQVTELGLQESVHLVGARTDVPRLLMAADLFVSSSHWEGMSVALLEAMAAGLPVVATAVGDAERMVDESTGLVVLPGQPQALAGAMRQLLADPARMRRMGQAGRARAATQYDRNSWAQSFINLYKNVVGHP
jgi:glycosyltransferase involved in cell wall biosynthesis